MSPVPPAVPTIDSVAAFPLLKHAFPVATETHQRRRVRCMACSLPAAPGASITSPSSPCPCAAHPHLHQLFGYLGCTPASAAATRGTQNSRIYPVQPRPAPPVPLYPRDSPGLAFRLAKMVPTKTLLCALLFPALGPLRICPRHVVHPSSSLASGPSLAVMQPHHHLRHSSKSPACLAHPPRLTSWNRPSCGSRLPTPLCFTAQPVPASPSPSPSPLWPP